MSNLTLDFLKTVNEAADAALSSIEQINDEVQQNNQLFASGNTQEGLESFGEITQVLDLFVKLIGSLSSALENHTENFQDLKRPEAELLDCIKSLFEAQVATDYSLLCDLLEHDLSANLDQWKEQFLLPITKACSKNIEQLTRDLKAEA
ncbi:MAG: hypothetical protein ACPGJV_11745 [Bacteriovoracaceae bacterium]